MPYTGRFVPFPPSGLIVGRAGGARKTAVPFFHYVPPFLGKTACYSFQTQREQPGGQEKKSGVRRFRRERFVVGSFFAL